MLFICYKRSLEEVFFDTFFKPGIYIFFIFFFCVFINSLTFKMYTEYSIQSKNAKTFDLKQRRSIRVIS